MMATGSGIYGRTPQYTSESVQDQEYVGLSVTRGFKTPSTANRSIRL